MIHAYGQKRRRQCLVLVAMGCAVLICFVCNLCTGSADLSWSESLQACFFRTSDNTMAQIIIFEIRLPPALMALLVGAALAVAGAEIQTVFHNPLASPYTLGVSAAAGCGAAVALMCNVSVLPVFISESIVPLSACVGACCCSLVLYYVARIKQGHCESMILTGVACAFLCNACIALLQYFASEDELQAIVFWLFGNVHRANWTHISITASVLCAAYVYCSSLSWKLTALRLGEQQARTLGIPVAQLRLRIIVVCSLLTAVAVCFVGSIGFVGLVAPHIARMTVGDDHRFFLPLSALTGAVLLSLASLLSKSLIPQMLFPVGIATSLIGAPFFMIMVIKKKQV